MSQNVYKEFFEEALKQVKEEYKTTKNIEEEIFSIRFNIKYESDTNDIITILVPSNFMWDQIKAKGGLKYDLEKKLHTLTGNKKIQLKEKIVEKKDTPVKKEVSIKKEVTKENVNKTHNQLKQDFTFDTFVPGENNDLAYKASFAVAKSPGKKWNPLLLYGGVGLGKTHLMQAIGNYIFSQSEQKSKICYLSAETFTNEFTSSLASKTVDKFKSKYRNLDVLLLDDIHFLQGKKGIQEEIFYVFNALRDKNAQLVFTCDRPISELKDFEERLQSRLSNGLNADMQMPNFETRIAIIKKKLDISKKIIPMVVIEYIAKNIETNVRDLESAINKMCAYAELIQEPLTIDVAKDQLKDIFNTNFTENISIETIQKVVSSEYQISISDIKSKKRDKKFVIPRHIAIYISRELTEFSFTEIGNEFGGRDHSSIMHGYEKIEAELKFDSTLKLKIKNLMEEIKNLKK